MHDDGLIHNHNWAMSRPAGHVVQPCDAPRVANPALVQTPSSVRHDELQYWG